MVGELTSGEGSQRLSGGEYRRGGGQSNFRNRRKGSPIPRHVGGGGRLVQHPAGWYQVTIQHGSRYDKDSVLKTILNGISPTALVAHYYKVDHDTKAAYFYVEEFEVAERIMNLDRKLELPDGFKMLLRVRGSMPQTKIDDSLKERMKLAMAKRYNQATKALDLTKFHADPDLSDIFCALARTPIMLAAIDIISENIPDLEALNLNDNKLNALEHMKVLATKLKNLKILYLGQNKVSRRLFVQRRRISNSFADFHADIARRSSRSTTRRNIPRRQPFPTSHQRPHVLCQVHRIFLAAIFWSHLSASFCKKLNTGQWRWNWTNIRLGF